MTRSRRSTRLTGPRTKYTEDPFEVAGVSGGSDSEAIPKPSERKGKRAAKADDSSDEEFQDVPDDEEEDEDVDMENDDDVYLGSGDEEPPMEEDDEQEGDEKSSGRKVPHPRYHKKRRPDGTVVLSGDETHSRGIVNPSEHVGKTVHFRVTFGTDERDVLAIIYARDRWGRGIDSCFPTRSSLNEALKMPEYGYGPTFGVDPEDVKRESTRGWDWYYGDDIGGRFRKKQRLEKISEDNARRTYMPQPKEEKHSVFMGPTDNQTLFKLGLHESVNFGEAWGEAKQKPSSKEDRADTSGAPKKMREGWVLNMGQKIQCTAWAPNQPGLTQYLAVVAPISEEQKNGYKGPFEGKMAPAFSPSAPYPSTLQLWTFKAKRGDSLTKPLDMDFKPRLRLALCTDWGDLKRLSWCPMPRATRDEDDEDALKNIGLVAGVWGDGCVRVLDIKISRDPNTAEFYKVHSSVFTAKPPSTVCTCVTWLSPSDIAVGCANGFVAIWSIAPSQTSQSNPLPYFYQQVHSTYILNLASAYPMHPHIICTTSMDGETRMSSITDHQKDKVETNRMRIGSPFVSFSPWLHSFFSSDENDFVRLLAVRRFFTTTAVARLPSTISALAPCSSWHPAVMFGCTGGAVVATNPIRRLLHPKEKQWQQIWFSHEWVRGKEAGSPGVSRFQDGYRADSISLLRNMMGDRKLINGTMMITIFEEGTHITALSWNPNQPCAGWASAGTGCGLLRVEDLAV
ncbi:hypothetical protein ASPWEDRAFT_169030 [Aspergillus wentii DTO 134E9]|uniref:Transcription factor TFIIIC complex subunit Tfc6 n=1 Tax=Aspergillus wentii DTO 134E9 TaxID=1073089 RepID=A0A1L9RW44_ASPWE|nr:uncharacterized protein ASPWEDRAFT_169030 [Aspergillus wentii DTO 134E9]KAI9929132.1 hypothetical protein MW887_001536 [Aspergillus wentii]OJJ39171.1 hypothetical protein ASPWEDRAFT_169030 [Aspergillus wentii DTO 134E9]